MHELSIATSIWELAQAHVPAGSVLQSVRMCAGPMRAIDPPSMQWAWQSVLKEKSLGKIKLEVVQLPWELCCRDCGKETTSNELLERCACGSSRIHPMGGDELQVVSIEVDEAQKSARAVLQRSAR